MNVGAWVLTALLGLIAGMGVLLEVGYRAGRRRLQREGPASSTGLGVVEGAIFALFGLLLAFTFSAGFSRFEARRVLAVEESNAIGTAYLRLDLLPAASQPELRDLFRRYADSRLEFYRHLTDPTAAADLLARSTELQAEIWSRAVVACSAEPRDPSKPVLVLGALNQMIDITTTRLYAARSHTPKLVYVLLFTLGLGCAVLAGYSMAAAGRRSRVHFAGFAIVAALTVYVILDLEYPRVGFISLEAYDQALVDLKETMK
jgi:hypothetical protein